MRTIKTRDFPDFEAIMKLIGQDDEAKETWEAMRRIHKAHLPGGRGSCRETPGTDPTG